MVLLDNLAKAVVVVLLIAVAFFLLVASCSRNAEKSDGSSFQSISGSSQEDASSGDVTGGSQAKRSAPKIDPKENSPITDEELKKLDKQLKIIADCAMPTTENGESADDMRFRLATELVNAAISRSTSKPATGDGAKVKDLRYEDYKIKWTYANAGDYDEDGEVTVADIAMVSAYLGADIDDGIGDDALEAWIDGNGDGEVTTADISVIAQNFLNRVDGYKLYRKMELSAKPIFVMNVALTDALDTHPKTFEIFDWYTPEQHWDYWPFLFASVIPVDERGKYGESSDYVAMNTITPTLTRTTMLSGVTGRVGCAEASFNYHVITPESLVETFEWDFGGGCIPNTASGSQVRVTFTEPGTYVGTLTATSQYGTFTERFPVVSKPVLKAEQNSLWIDAYNIPYYCEDSSESDVKMDIYAVNYDKVVFELAEFNVIFDDVVRKPGDYIGGFNSQAVYYRFDSSNSCAIESVLNGSQFALNSTIYSINEKVLSVNSSLLASTIIGRCTFEAKEPTAITITHYDRNKCLSGDLSGNVISLNFDGWFDWQTYDLSFNDQTKNLGTPFNLEAELAADNTVKVTYKEAIFGDCNGNNRVELSDILGIKLLYLNSADDGVLDEFNDQCDIDANGEVAVTDITGIVANYLCYAPGFRLKRDDVIIYEYKVQCPKPRNNMLLNLWPTVEYTDENVPIGNRKYSLCVYDPATGEEGYARSCTVKVTGS